MMTSGRSEPAAFWRKEELKMNEQKHGMESLKEILKDLPEGNIVTVPFKAEKEEPHAVRTRKRLYSYGERAAAFKR